MLTKEEALKVADLLAHVSLNAVNPHPTALNIQEFLKEIADLQNKLRPMADQ